MPISLSLHLRETSYCKQGVWTACMQCADVCRKQAGTCTQQAHITIAGLHLQAADRHLPFRLDLLHQSGPPGPGATTASQTQCLVTYVVLRQVKAACRQPADTSRKQASTCTQQANICTLTKGRWDWAAQDALGPEAAAAH